MQVDPITLEVISNRLEEIQRIPTREPNLRAMMKAMEEWRNFRIVQPELVLTQAMTLHVDDVTIEIEHVGGNHSPDSLVVRLPQSRVLFLGDCYYLPPLHVRNPEDTFNFAMMRSLIHDDIQDNSPIRHGRPTVWKIWGHANAINAGDALFGLAYCALEELNNAGLPPDVTLEAWRIFNQTVQELTRGQHLDMRFEALEVVSVDDYLSMIRGKSTSNSPTHC